ncbi:MAG: protein kinase [Elusimicrobia bacterium]|nr:protein kinase [Elusimicrobiota bacterium]
MKPFANAVRLLFALAAACLALPDQARPGASADEHVRKAEAALEAGDFQQALAEAGRAVSLDPESRKGRALEASALNRLGRFAEAEISASRSLKLKFDNPAAHENLAFARLNLGKYKECIDSATNVIHFDASSALAYALRASAYEQLKLEDRKLADIRAAAALNPAQYSGHLLAARKGERIFVPPGVAGKALPGWAGILVLALGSLAGAGLLARLKKPHPSLTSERRSLGTYQTNAFPMFGTAQAPAEEAVGAGGLLGGKYRRDRRIGRGGMGEVWEGWDVSLERPVAIKQALAADEGSLALMREFCLKEARAVALLRHPNIADIYDVLDLPEGVFLVFEFIKGKTLDHILAERKRLPLAEAREFLRPVCAALEFARGRGVVHRDIKPSNIMVSGQGPVKVMDFGIARAIGAAPKPEPGGQGACAHAGPTASRTLTVAGTPGYMAPETEQGLVSAALDVYSLGVCLYEMLTGSRPNLPNVVDSDVSNLRRLESSIRPFGPAGGAYCAKPSALVPGLPAEADALLAKALAPRREDRLQSAGEFLALLESLPV